MKSHLRFLSGIMLFIRLKLVLGNTNNASKCSCFLQPNLDEFIRELMKKTGNMVILNRDAKNYENFIVNLELNRIIDERIKAYMDANYAYGKDGKAKLNEKNPNDDFHIQKSEQKSFKRSVTENPEDLLHDADDKNDEQREMKRRISILERKYLKFRHRTYVIRDKINQKMMQFKDKIMAEENACIELESKLEQILEFVCSFIFAVQDSVGVDFPLLFRESHWIKCDKKFQSRKLSTLAFYKELEDLTATCPGLDSCEMNRKSDSLLEYNCQCGRLCSTLDTCCFDSPFLGVPSNGPFQSCQVVYGITGSSYFMVDQCPRNGTAGDVWKDLCANGEENDFMTYVPVTSTRTNLTYRNYYCFACHETTQDFFFWEVEVHSIKNITFRDNGSPILVFDSVRKRWMGQDGLNNRSVLIAINKLPEFNGSLTECRESVISKCHDVWVDDISRNKCIAYTALITLYREDTDTPYRLYKNPHCAICNFESFNHTYCNHTKRKSADFWNDFKDDFKRDFGVKLQDGFEDDFEDDFEGDFQRVFKLYFSYTNFFALTTNLCPENAVWNPFSSECSPLKCTKGYSLKNGACILS